MLCSKAMGCKKALIPWEAGVGQVENEEATCGKDPFNSYCLTTWGQMSAGQNYAHQTPGFLGQHAAELRTHPQWHVRWVAARGDERTLIAKFNWQLHCKISLTDLLTEELLQLKSSKAALTSSTISTNVNPRVADVISEGEERAQQNPSFKRVDVVRRI